PNKNFTHKLINCQGDCLLNTYLKIVFIQSLLQFRLLQHPFQFHHLQNLILYILYPLLIKFHLHQLYLFFASVIFFSLVWLLGYQRFKPQLLDPNAVKRPSIFKSVYNCANLSSFADSDNPLTFATSLNIAKKLNSLFSSIKYSYAKSTNDSLSISF